MSKTFDWDLLFFAIKLMIAAGIVIAVLVGLLAFIIAFPLPAIAIAIILGIIEVVSRK